MDAAVLAASGFGLNSHCHLYVSLVDIGSELEAVSLCKKRLT